jgi:hypothetical protein
MTILYQYIDSTEKNGNMYLNEKLGKTWKEAAMPTLRYYPSTLFLKI